MPPDSTATRARILEAAFREFATYGLAGARVDRIAATARANKRAIYAYFGNKETLFDRVLASQLTLGAADLPDRRADLADYAATVVDFFAADPDRARLVSWRQLERPQAAHHEVEAIRSKLAGYRTAGGKASQSDPADLLALIAAMTMSWFLAPDAVRQSAAELSGSPQRLVKHRDAVVEAVRRLLVTGPAKDKNRSSAGAPDPATDGLF
jgi:AcrR family transcriptional regulator